MDILMIKASNQSDFKAYKDYMSSPPQNIFSLAAATPEEFNYLLVDETTGDRVPEKHTARLAVIFASTPDILRAYQLSAQLRQEGVTTVMAGLHATFLPEESAQYADSVIVGEAELVWESLLEDFLLGQLQLRYHQPGPVDVSTLKPWPADSALQQRYGEWGVLVGRGCCYNCSYCTVRPFFNRQAMRPVGHVIDEIRSSGAQYLELHADNLCSDREYALELFNALAPLNIGWSGEANLDFAEDEELLDAAARSGLWYLLVGLETCSQPALDKAGKGFLDIGRSRELIHRLHQYDVIVDSCLLFGFDEHDAGIFEETVDFVQDIKLDVPHPNFITPFPGTRFFEKLKKDGRLLTTDWADYDCSHVVFEPGQMSVDELERGVDWVTRKLGGVVKTFTRTKRIADMQGWSIALGTGM